MTENLASNRLFLFHCSNKSNRGKFPEFPESSNLKKKNCKKFQTKTQIHQEIFSLKIKIIKKILGGGKKWRSNRRKEKQ